MAKRGRVIVAGFVSCAVVFVAEQVLFASYLATALNVPVPPLPQGMTSDTHTLNVVPPAPPLIPTSIVIAVLLSAAAVGAFALLVRSGVRVRTAAIAVSVGPVLALALSFAFTIIDLVTGPADLRVQTFTGYPALQTASELIAFGIPLACLAVGAFRTRRKASPAGIDASSQPDGSA